MPTNFMGIDSAFSKTRWTTRVACLDRDQLSVERAGTAWASREAKMPKGFQPSVIAIDGPLLPLGADLETQGKATPLVQTLNPPSTQPQTLYVNEHGTRFFAAVI